VASPDLFLINSERLISDARLLFADGRARSAAALIVVALEQMLLKRLCAKNILMQKFIGIFGEAGVKQIIDLAARVRTTLARSFVVSGRMMLAEANVPGFVPITLCSPLK